MKRLYGDVTLCWRNTAQWERNNLRWHGRIYADSPRGVWMIRQAGWAWMGRG